MRNESRFRMIERADPARFKYFLEEAQAAATRRYSGYQQLAQITLPARTAHATNADGNGAPVDNGVASGNGEVKQ
jgi:hypothetical protein